MKINCEACGSSDAREVYEDHTYCYSGSCPQPYQSLKERVQMNGNNTHTSSVPSHSLMEIHDYRSYPIASRGISQEVVDYLM